MADKDDAVVDMRWLVNGEADKHPDYVTRPREDLAGSYISDDELAYMAAMMSTITDEQDLAKMMASHRAGGDGDYISKSMTGEIIKDRLRWLSRRVAVLEGRYPGKTVADLADSVPAAPIMPHPVLGKKEDAFDAAVAESRLDRQVPLLAAVLNLPDGVHPNNMAALLDERRIRIDSLKASVALGLFMDKKPLQRWQIYVGLARDLLKQGIYIPFWDDEYAVSGPNQNILTIIKSKYFGTGKRHQITKLATMETPVVNASLADILGGDRPGLGEHYKDTIVDTEDRTGSIDLKPYEARAREIYDSWKDVEGWEPWVEGGNSLRQEQAFARAIHEAGAVEPGATSNHENN